MIYISAAIVLVALLGWDILRRCVTYKPPPDDKRIAQLEANHQQLAVDVLHALDEMQKTDKVTSNLASEWLVKFKTFEDSQKDLETKLTAKLGGTIANLPAKGYNR